MKKLLIYFLSIMVSSSANAQHTGFYAGLNVALQKSSILCSSDKDLETQLDVEKTFNVAYGLDLGYKINPQIGFQTGVIYSQQGQKYLTKGNTNANYKTDLTYIKIPLLFCYHLMPDKKLSFIAQAGFQLSLLSEAKSSRDKVFLYYSSYYMDVKDFYSSIPIDLAMGFGLQYSLQNMCINLLIKSDYSISDIEKTEKKPGLRAPASNFTLGIPQLGFQYYFN